MKVKIQVTTYEEIEVNYPVFKAHGYCLYKMTEDTTIEVRTEEKSKSIQVGICYRDLILRAGEDITEQKFNSAFIEVLEHINSHSPLATIS